MESGTSISEMKELDSSLRDEQFGIAHIYVKVYPGGAASAEKSSKVVVDFRHVDTACERLYCKGKTSTKL
jgi:hypothetical protein